MHSSWKVYAYKGDELVAEYLFAIKKDAEKFKKDMQSKEFKTELVHQQVGT
tara:strand:- start:863 stop:1015 length:153 start_codon:yes stop_codon:yes gene_type:complete